jgi:hypothetical protein
LRKYSDRPHPQQGLYQVIGKPGSGLLQHCGLLGKVSDDGTVLITLQGSVAAGQHPDGGSAHRR